jgi:4,5-dihydroxyphthalate decarboxylase
VHTIVIKREVYEQNPWIAQSLFDAFDEAKRRAMTNI